MNKWNIHTKYKWFLHTARYLYCYMLFCFLIVCLFVVIKMSDSWLVSANCFSCTMIIFCLWSDEMSWHIRRSTHFRVTNSTSFLQSHSSPHKVILSKKIQINPYSYDINLAIDWAKKWNECYLMRCAVKSM